MPLHVQGLTTESPPLMASMLRRRQDHQGSIGVRADESDVRGAIRPRDGEGEGEPCLACSMMACAMHAQMCVHCRPCSNTTSANNYLACTMEPALTHAMASPVCRMAR